MKSFVQTPTNNLEESHLFYTRLGFAHEADSSGNYYSDGSLMIYVNPDRYARTGIRLSSNWNFDELKREITTVSTPQGVLVSSPSGCWVYLDVAENYPPVHFSSEISSSVLGNYAGVSIETISIQQSIDFWTLLGFKQTAGSADAGWVSLANDEGFAISLMKAFSCPHLFFSPSLTYFNGKDNLDVIQKIRDLKIPIVEEITHFNPDGLVDNIIIRDPGGLGCFLFND